jgi:hypothetical protein
MINIKYLVLFMIGIFLALGLGIMIGITLESQNIIENQQTQLIHQIEEHFVNLRIETEQMKLEIDNLEDKKTQLQKLSSLLLTEVIQGKLTGMQLGVVTFSEQAPMKELLDFFDLTGATIQSAVTVCCNRSDNSETMVNATQQPDDITTTIVQELIYSMGYGDVTPLIQEALDLMMISHAGYFESPVDSIVLVAQGNSTLEYDNILIHSAIEAGIPVVVVETSEFSSKTLSKYRSLGISTVDYIESTYGKLALASVLSGNKGNFGLSSGDLDVLTNPLFFQELQLEFNDAYTTNGGEAP